MAPDADAASLVRRGDPFAPLTSEWLAVGDGHEVYLESIGTAGGIPAVYLHGGPGSGCQPDHRRLFDPERFHTVLFDQRGAGRSRPRGARAHNTLPHLVADMEVIREKFGFARWMVVGGSWGATLALAYAQTHPERVSSIVLRATFLGTPAELRAAFQENLPRFYPGLADDFVGLLSPEERTDPLAAYYRRILDPDARVHGPAARAWYATERILSEIRPARTRFETATLDGAGALPSTPFMEAHYFSQHCFMAPDQLLNGAHLLAGIPSIVVQGRYDLLCSPAISHALATRWSEAEIRLIEGAGHNLYDPGIRNGVMKAIADAATKAR